MTTSTRQETGISNLYSSLSKQGKPVGGSAAAFTIVSNTPSTQMSIVSVSETLVLCVGASSRIGTWSSRSTNTSPRVRFTDVMVMLASPTFVNTYSYVTSMVQSRFSSAPSEHDSTSSPPYTSFRKKSTLPDVFIVTVWNRVVPSALEMSHDSVSGRVLPATGDVTVTGPPMGTTPLKNEVVPSEHEMRQSPVVGAPPSVKSTQVEASPCELRSPAHEPPT